MWGKRGGGAGHRAPAPYMGLLGSRFGRFGKQAGLGRGVKLLARLAGRQGGSGGDRAAGSQPRV